MIPPSMETAMTQAEIENELSRLREQLSQAQRHQETRKQRLGQLGIRSLIVGMCFLIVGLYFGAVNIYNQREVLAGVLPMLVFVSFPLMYLYDLAKLEKS
jgi:hypothetical protein